MSDEYDCPARVHASPDAPLVTLRWYFTDQPFLTEPQIINSTHWKSEVERCEDDLVGEKWDVDPWPRKPLNIQGLQGGHQCGTTSDFTNGQPWPYTGPPIEYDEDNIPLCCPRQRWPMVGAFPSAVVGYQFPVHVMAGASPTAVVHYAPAHSASVTAGASPTAVVRYFPMHLAEVLAGASPTAVVGYQFPVHVLAGASPSAVALFVEPPTPVVLAGASPSAVALFVEPPTPVVLAGASPTAEVEYIPPTPIPGNTCLTAGAIAVGAEYSGAISAGNTDWFTFTQTSGESYTVTVSDVTGGPVQTGAGRGTCSIMIALIFPPIDDDGSGGWTASATEQVWIHVVAIGSVSYTLQLTSP